jgi:hypothetical protein
MNWYYKISKKKKKKRKKKNKPSGKGLIQPYVLNEELGLMYQTPNGLAFAEEEEDLKIEAD